MPPFRKKSRLAPAKPKPSHVHNQVDWLMHDWPVKPKAFFQAVEEFGYEIDERFAAQADQVDALAYVASILRARANEPGTSQPHATNLRYYADWLTSRRRAIVAKISRPRHPNERAYNYGPEVSGGLPETNRRRH